MGQWLKDVIGTPRECLKVENEFAYRIKAQQVMLAYGVPPILRERDETPVAYVNEGRWVIDCDCGNGCIAGPVGWDGGNVSVAICFECGSVYRPAFPLTRASIETVLLARPAVHQRNFMADPANAEKHGLSRPQRLADLIRLNKDNGHPKRRGGNA